MKALNHLSPVFCLLCSVLAFAQAPDSAAIELKALSADSIVARLDFNTTAGALSFEATMEISIAGQIRTKSFRGCTEGGDRSYMEFTAPARDRDTRFLKLGDEMWMWIPRVGKSTKLSGHMLRQSMMGSDFSYSDAAENRSLLDRYDVTLQGTDTVSLGNRDRTCYLLDLTARSPNVDYARQRIWVTPDDFIPAKVEYYAASGKLLKEMRVLASQPVKDRNYPTRVRMTNLLRQNTWTVMDLTELELDPVIPPEVFTKAWLER